LLTHYSHFPQYHTHEPPLVCRGALHWNGPTSPADGATIYSSPPYTPLPPNMTSKSTSPSSINTQGAPKRRRKTQSDDAARPATPGSATATSASGGGVGPGTPGGGPGGTSSAFRNVSACNRCRLRKNRCDQRLPACLSCEKAVCTLLFPIPLFSFLFSFFLFSLGKSRRDRDMRRVSAARLCCVYYFQC
jgi:hypothetical protein